MKKSNIIIINILSIVIICLVGGIIYINNYYIKQLNYINYTNVDETKGKEYDCSFTRTYKIIDLMKEYRAAVPEGSFIIVDQFQFFEPVVHSLPTKLKENLIVGEYYEFTYHLKGKIDESKELEMIDVVGMIVEEHPDNDNLTATLQIKKTDKLGLDQIQEPICKSSK